MEEAEAVSPTLQVQKQAWSNPSQLSPVSRQSLEDDEPGQPNSYLKPQLLPASQARPGWSVCLSWSVCRNLEKHDLSLSSD